VCGSVLYVAVGVLSEVVYSVEEWPWQAESYQFTISGVTNCAYAVARKQEVRIGWVGFRGEFAALPEPLPETTNGGDQPDCELGGPLLSISLAEML
jgi:hypothetical protein